ncbi:MAG: RdgB/HAM1 family non-canonical purine NTP pyrophosphatase [Firmicutes bacterium]|nr:RdgB/HAM1 family non-canonical purine NTP pyrophosphatase [Bacillota bacterium]
MEKKLLLATGNAHKVREIKEIFAEQGLTGWEIIDLSSFPAYEPPEEDGDSFRANAAIKAAAAARMSGLIALADDSGLAVEYLDGAPGIYSARYAGTGDDADNRKKLLSVLTDVEEEQRAGAFVCCACLAFPAEDGDVGLWFGEGRCEGRIARAERGENGFGYDSLFYLPERGCTMAELAPDLKNRLSHRFRAMSKAAAFLSRFGADL